MRLDTHRHRRRPAGPVRLERPRLGLDTNVLEELIGAALEREDTLGDPCRRVTLARGRAALEAELARMTAA